jgi:ABC-2 type transport system permease protein
MKQIIAITRKELEGYFSSLMALIFVGVFLAITLFSFFWQGDSFFARGIADVRPLFEWMPLLMIFLVAALTMRQWSEEQRSGTMEVLLTLPVSNLQLVIGKFLAVMGLVVISLALTIFLPLTVSLLGPLDWGPVIGGYLAAILLAAAYAAIGLFVSSRTDNQIVALIVTGLVCGLFYLIGSGGMTDFVSDQAAELLRALGSGSRFESILRGVVDLRDLAYYLSLTGVFLMLNVFSLEHKRWGVGERLQPQRVGMTLTAVLVVVNLLAFNVWLYPLRALRVDLTAGNQYTLSPTTRNLLDNLQEPLLIRGYFSEKTHPLLAPLAPQIRDMLREYEVAASGMLELDIIDPVKHPEKEAEANQTYGIRPSPFQVAGRYETSIINSYFDILIRYGDQNVVLNFSDLIEVQTGRGDVEVRLRNLEYDLTSSIKKVVYGFQSLDAILAALEEPARLTLYVTPDMLPPQLAEAGVVDTIVQVAEEISSESGGKFTYEVVDPRTSDSPLTPQELYEQYGIQPFALSLFSSESYYLHLLLQVGDQAQPIYPSGDMSEADIRIAIESALKRSTTGFLQVVGLWTPPAEPTQDMFGQMQEPLSSWQQLTQALRQEYEVRNVDLSSGQTPADVDVLLVVAPQRMTDKERFAIDQYLMRGGAVIAAAGNYAITIDQMAGGLALQPLAEGLQDMLASYGFTVEDSLVLDMQNEQFPVPRVRDVGGFQVQEITAIEYPFFVDVRPDGMVSGSGDEVAIVSNLPAVTLNWASPITLNEERISGLEVATLLQSSPDSWTQTDINIQPNFDLYPDVGFPVGVEQQSYPLAVAAQGVFESYFKDQPSPFAADVFSEDTETGAQEAPQPPLAGVIGESSANARLIVVGSAEFVDDVVFEISSNLSMDRYLNSLKLVQNAVAWATEDQDLLDIRARGTYARLLRDMSEREQFLWEVANYALALFSLLVVGVVWNARRKNEQPMALIAPEEIAQSVSESDSEVQ